MKQQMVEEHENDPKYHWDTYAKQGWHKREHVAEALECHEDKVQTLLKSAISSGKIERRDITIWDKLNKELVKVVSYREKGKGTDVVAPRRGRGRPKSRVVRKPEEGMTVRSRATGNLGKILEIRRGRMNVEWDSGRNTECSLKAIPKGDILLEF